MHFPDFKTETLPQQAGALCRDGVYLSERRSGDFLVALYALSDFYAEVWYHRQTNALQMITSFQGTSLLEPCLAKIDVLALLQPVLYQ